jgi:cyanophycin synthetase
VTIGVMNAQDAAAAYASAAEQGSAVIVEQQFIGNDYRMLVVDGKLVAVAERVPAHVIGDGERTIAALIEQVNLDPRRGEGHEKVLTRIEIDQSLVAHLAKQNMTLETIPPAGTKIVLRDTANLSTGGTAIDRTDEVHPENVSIAIRAARTLGLDIAGIDMIAPDIARSVRETGGGIVEVNAAPGFRMHLEPSSGTPRNVARHVVDMLFPNNATGRIPIFAITGTNGKSTTAQMVASILKAAGHTVGLTSTSGIYVNGERIYACDASGPQSAGVILRDPTVDAAVLETARGGILREGLAFDECDVGAVLNIAPDHLGLNGINTLEQLAAVKSVVVETVYRNGCSVLNADNQYTRDMARHAKGRIAFFTMKPLTPLLKEHIELGGQVVMHEDGSIFIHDNRERTRLIGSDEIPATLGGLVEFNIENALAAAAMCHGAGIPHAAIRQGLSSFKASVQQCPGRFNVHDGHGFRVIVDYAHNPDALRAVGRAVEKMRSRHRRVIGVVCIPGDRRDDDIKEMGAIATTIFDDLVLIEDEDTRGRPKGETVTLLQQGVQQTGCSPDRVTVATGEIEAVRHCLQRAHAKDLVVLIGAFVEKIWNEVETFRSEPRGTATLEASHA